MMRIGFTGYSAGVRACLASHGSASKAAAHAAARHAIGIREALRGATVIRLAMKAVTECPIVILKLSRGSPGPLATRQRPGAGYVTFPSNRPQIADWLQNFRGSTTSGR